MKSYSAEIIRVNRALAVDPNDRFLLLQRSDTDSSEPNLWELPGGKQDDTDADETAAVCREVFEETGLKIIDPLPIYTRQDVYTNGKNAGKTYFLTIFAERTDSIVIKRSFEHNNEGWFTPDTAMELPLTPTTDRFLHDLGAVGLQNLIYRSSSDNNAAS